MTKTITIAAIIGAFVIGTFSYASLAEASPANDAVVAALDRIVDAINGIQPNVTVNSIEGEQGIQGETGTVGTGSSSYYVIVEHDSDGVVYCEQGDVFISWTTEIQNDMTYITASCIINQI